MIPRHILKEHIFPYLSTIDNFKLREVNSIWNDITRCSWLKALKIALHKHVIPLLGFIT